MIQSTIFNAPIILIVVVTSIAAAITLVAVFMQKTDTDYLQQKKRD